MAPETALAEQPAAATAVAAAPPAVRTAADLPALLERLGGVPPERVLLNPPPGTATEADAVRLQDSADKRLCEVVFGTLVEKAMGDEEAFVAAALIGEVYGYLKTHALGQVSGADGRKAMSGGNTRMPDVSFIGNERLDGGVVATGSTGRPPHLAVEVISLSNTAAEITLKRTEYFASGVRLVWEIDPPSRTAIAWTALDARTDIPTGGTLDGRDVLPDFSVPLADLLKSLGPPQRP